MIVVIHPYPKSEIHEGLNTLEPPKEPSPPAYPLEIFEEPHENMPKCDLVTK